MIHSSFSKYPFELGGASWVLPLDLVNGNTAKNIVISPNFLVWKFCGKANRPKLCVNCAFHKIFTPGNQVKLRFFRSVKHKVIWDPLIEHDSIGLPLRKFNENYTKKPLDFCLFSDYWKIIAFWGPKKFHSRAFAV